MIGLRLLKITVQPIFVVIDNGTVEEMAAEPITIPAKDWPGFPARLEEQRVLHEAALNEPAVTLDAAE